MSDQPVVLPVRGHAELRLSTTSGHVAVTAEERADVLIVSGAPSEEKIDIDATGRVTLRSAKGGSANLEVRCPAGTDLVVGTISGRVELRGPLGEVRVTNVSGSVAVERAEALDVRSVSGNIEVDRCAGRCRLQTKSGQATIGSAGDTAVSTVSGRVRLDGATSNVRAQSVSGTVEVGMQGKGDVAIQTISGSVRVAVPTGVRPMARLRSMAGRPRCDCEQGNDCQIAVQSMSGRIEVVPS